MGKLDIPYRKVLYIVDDIGQLEFEIPSICPICHQGGCPCVLAKSHHNDENGKRIVRWPTLSTIKFRGQ